MMNIELDVLVKKDNNLQIEKVYLNNGEDYNKINFEK